MAKQVDKISNFFENRATGLLEVRGPAGSGKTYSLVSIARSLLENQNKKGYIISLTNVAVYELQQRMGEKFTDKIMTSHHFAVIWIKRFLLSLIYDEKIHWNKNSLWRKFKYNNIREIVFIENPGIDMETKNSQYNVLPHQILELFEEAIDKSPEFASKICSDIDYIFIDEYQDTDDNFLKTLIRVYKSRITIALFGDPMQKLYMSSQLDISDIETLTDEQFFLTTNYRSDSNLIPLFNGLRLEVEGLDQTSPVNASSKGRVFLISADRELRKHDDLEISRKTGIDTWKYLTTTHILRIGLGTDSTLEVITKIRNSLNQKFSKKISIPQIIENNDSIPELQIIMGVGALGKENFNYHDIRRISNLFGISAKTKNWPVDYLRKVKRLLVNNNLSFIDDLNFSEEILDWSKMILADYKNNLQDLYTNLSVSQFNKAYTIQGVKGLEFENVVVNLDQGQYRSLALDKMNLIEKGYGRSKRSNFMFYVGVTRARENVAIFVNNIAAPNLLNSVQSFLKQVKGLEYTEIRLD